MPDPAFPVSELREARAWIARTAQTLAQRSDRTEAWRLLDRIDAALARAALDKPARQDDNEATEEGIVWLDGQRWHVVRLTPDGEGAVCRLLPAPPSASPPDQEQ
jgi:hypothetical protein